MSASTGRCVLRVFSRFSTKCQSIIYFKRALLLVSNDVVVPRILCSRTLTLSSPLYEEQESTGKSSDKENDEEAGVLQVKGRPVLDVDVETSIRYMESKAYYTTYGSDPVWTKYRRNFKGQWAPAKTRKTCIRSGALSTGNPCPVCRDDYLVVDHRNVKLLNQFISPYTGEILSYQKTCACQKQHKNLLVAIERAKDYGFIEEEVPFREYDYTKYYPKDKLRSSS